MTPRKVSIDPTITAETKCRRNARMKSAAARIMEDIADIALLEGDHEKAADSRANAAELLELSAFFLLAADHPATAEAAMAAEFASRAGSPDAPALFDHAASLVATRIHDAAVSAEEMTLDEISARLA
jgi:hypothetical protein